MTSNLNNLNNLNSLNSLNNTANHRAFNEVRNGSQDSITEGTPQANSNAYNLLADTPVAQAASSLRSHLCSTHGHQYLDNINASKSHSSTSSQHLSTALSHAALITLPLARISATILKGYSSVAYGLGLVTENAALEYINPVKVNLHAEAEVDSPLGSDSCPIDITDHFPIDDNPGIDLSNTNLNLSLLGFFLSDLTKRVCDQLENRANGHLTSKSVINGIQKGLRQFILSQKSDPTNEDDTATEATKAHPSNNASPLCRINPLTCAEGIERLFRHSGLMGMLAFMNTAVLQDGMPLSTFKGLNNAQILFPQHAPFSGNYTRSCDVEPLPSESSSPIINTEMTGTLYIPASYTRGLNADSLMRTVLLISACGYILGNCSMRQINQTRIEQAAFETTLNYLNTHADELTTDLTGLKNALEERLILSDNLIPSAVYQSAKSSINIAIDHISEPSFESERCNNLSTRALDTLKLLGQPARLLKTFAETLDSFSDALIGVSMVVQSSSEGIDHISSGFNNLTTSAESTFRFTGDYSNTTDQTGETSTLTGLYSADVIFPKTRTKGISYDKTLHMLVLSILSKLTAKFLLSYVKRRELNEAIQKIASDAPANKPAQLTPSLPCTLLESGAETFQSHLIDRPTLIRHIVDQLCVQGHISNIEHSGFKLGKLIAVPGLKNYIPSLITEQTTQHDTHQCDSLKKRVSNTLSIPRRAALSAVDATQQLLYDLVNKVGTLGLFLGVGAQFTEEFINGSAIRFENNATIDITLNTTLTSGDLVRYQVHNSTRNITLEDLLVPNPSEVTLYVAIAGLSAGSCLLPLSAFLDIIHNESIVKSEIQNALHALDLKNTEREKSLESAV